MLGVMNDVSRSADEIRARWRELAVSDFVSVGTYRRNGELVATPVWIAADGDALVLTSEIETGKVKRLRNNPRVLVRVCDRFGRVPVEDMQVSGFGSIVEESERAQHAMNALRAKYGMQFPLILGFERLVRRVQRRSVERVIIAIEPEAL